MYELSSPPATTDTVPGLAFAVASGLSPLLISQSETRR
jgi:hypothetical protein